MLLFFLNPINAAKGGKITSTYDVIVTANGTNLVQLTVGKTGEVSVAKNSQVGQLLMEAYHKGATITAVL